MEKKSRRGNNFRTMKANYVRFDGATKADSFESRFERNQPTAIIQRKEKLPNEENRIIYRYSTSYLKYQVEKT